MHTPLRSRVILAFLLTGALLSSFFGAGAYLAGQTIEMMFIKDTLGAELTHYLKLLQDDPQAQPVPSRLRVYTEPPGEGEPLPAFLKGLEPGTYERHYDGREYHIAVKDQGGRRHYLAYDSSNIESWERLLHRLLLAIVAISTLFSLWLGVWLTRRVLAPVISLAKDIEHLPAESCSADLSPHFANDEVGELARSFDRCLRRMGAFVKREADFTADVSHELRTPVTVIRTTTELLMSMLHGEESLRDPLRRVERAAWHMSNLIEVFLILAREDEPSKKETAEAYHVQPVIRELLDARSDELAHNGVTVTLAAEVNPQVYAPRTALAVVLDNLLGNAVAHTQDGWIRIIVKENSVAVADSGKGIPDTEQEHVFQRRYRGSRASGRGSGLGLSIVKRLCDRYGWRIDIDSDEGTGTLVSLVFPSDR